VQFRYPALPAARRSYWLIVEPGEAVDLCSVDPGFDVDLYVTTDLRSMTAIWMGLDTVRAAIDEDRMVLSGDQHLAATMQAWLGLSPFAVEKKRVGGGAFAPAPKPTRSTRDEPCLMA
jgi:hypothetical protein